jgi:hypothetical protein
MVTFTYMEEEMDSLGLIVVCLLVAQILTVLLMWVPGFMHLFEHDGTFPVNKSLYNDGIFIVTLDPKPGH